MYQSARRSTGSAEDEGESQNRLRLVHLGIQHLILYDKVCHSYNHDYARHGV